MNGYPKPDGTEVLDEVYAFIGRFVAYPNEHARVAHVLWLAHTWLMDRWDSTPRIAFLSPEKGSGKSRALEVSERLVPRPVMTLNTTPAYLFRKVGDPEGRPTILYDEVDTLFGPKAKDNEETRGLLNAGHRNGATAGRCSVHGKTIVTEELPAYCAVALAGLNNLPDTIMSRSVIISMRRRGPAERVEPWRNRINAPEAEAIAVRLEQWARGFDGVEVAWPTPPAGIADRDADVWEALLTVAQMAGGDWPERSRVAAVSLVALSRETDTETIGVTLLRDLQAVFAHTAKLSTEDVLTALHDMVEQPWRDLRGKPIDARFLSRTLKKYGVKPKTMRIGNGTPRGYERADLVDPWARYVAPAAAPLWKTGNVEESTSADPALPIDATSATRPATSATPGAAPLSSRNSATSATSATGGLPSCRVCGEPMPWAEPGQTAHPCCEADCTGTDAPPDDGLDPWLSAASGLATGDAR